MIAEENLLFVISQPRSGSSLLQQLLLSSGEVDSIPEPWLMLALTQVFREPTNQSEFNPRYTFLNFKEYLSSFEDGFKIVKDEIKKLILRLYNLNELGEKKFFLDKTPRYYHIIDEIREMFPSSKIIIILRNPISVFASILDYNFKGNLNEIFRDDRLDDLYKAPVIFSKIIQENDKNIYFVKYEDIVNNPGPALNGIGIFLGLKHVFSDSPEYLLNSEFLKTKSIDRKGVIVNKGINNKYLDSWKETINTRQKKQLLKTYLKTLGPDVVSVLGYNYHELFLTVEEHPVRFNFEIAYDYLLYKGNKIGFYSFIKSRLSDRLNKFFYNG